MTVISDGSRSSVSRSTPRIRQTTSSASSTGRAPKPRHCQVLSSSTAKVRYMSRWRVSTGRSVGSSGPAALLVDDVERADDPDVVEEVGEVAGPPAAVEVADEGRPADRAEDEVRPAEGRRSARGSGRGGELRRARSRPAPRPGPDRGGRCGSGGPPWRRRRRTHPAPGRRAPPSPISARIRSDARWIASTWSADRISSGRNGLTSRRQGSWASPGGGGGDGPPADRGPSGGRRAAAWLRGFHAGIYDRARPPERRPSCVARPARAPTPASQMPLRRRRLQWQRVSAARLCGPTSPVRRPIESRAERSNTERPHEVESGGSPPAAGGRSRHGGVRPVRAGQQRLGRRAHYLTADRQPGQRDATGRRHRQRPRRPPPMSWPSDRDPVLSTSSSSGSARAAAPAPVGWRRRPAGWSRTSPSASAIAWPRATCWPPRTPPARRRRSTWPRPTWPSPRLGSPSTRRG